MRPTRWISCRSRCSPSRPLRPRRSQARVASRATYTDEQKAQVYVALTANDGNVKRTSRETGVPEGTVRTWKNLWKSEPPAADKVEEAASDFIGEAETVRNM